MWGIKRGFSHKVKKSSGKSQGSTDAKRNRGNWVRSKIARIKSERVKPKSAP